MKSKFIIIIISLLVIICLTGISFQFNNDHHSTFSVKGKVVLISEKSVNREMIDKID